MNHLGLFEGIGGFSLAARWMGWNTVAWCEWNEFGQKVLKYHFPESEGYGDITKTNFTKYANKIDILTGGFPCQPYSIAGKRKGKDDERHLWPEMLRAIREIQPTWVVGENVSGIINWNGGMVFDEVQVDLEAEGYEIIPFILPACAVNAPHRRDRVWFIAYSIGTIERRNKFSSLRCENAKIDKQRTQTIYNAIGSDGIERNVTDTNNDGQQWSNSKHEINTSEGREHALNDFEQTIINTECIRWIESQNDNGQFKKTQQKECGKKQFSGTNSTHDKWRNFPTQSPICSGNDGVPTGLDGITFPKWRAESIKAYGNAIVPQVAFEIFKAIENFNNLLQ